jgi:hypothetical protein
MTKYREDMTDEELNNFIKEIDALHEAYTDAFKEPAWTEEIDEETGDILLYKAALNRGQP